MKSTFRLLAAVALLGFLSGCAQLGIPSPSGMSNPDMPLYSNGQIS